jgi:hypothetical protein
MDRLSRHFLLVPGLLAVLMLSVGCGPGSADPRPSCTLDDSLAANSLSATVDGEPWEATSGGYQLGATGLLASFSVDAANYMSLRLVTATLFELSADGVISELEGDDVADVLSSDDFPADFELGDSATEGADATLAVDGDTLHTGEGDGGFLRLVSQTDDILRGCFFFNADGQGSTSAGDVDLEEGSFALSPL